MYFDLKSNPAVKVPAKFASLQEAVDFMTTNYKRVNKDGSRYGVMPGGKTVAMTATTTSDDDSYAEVSSPNSGATFGLVSSGTHNQESDYNISSFNTNPSEFCQEWLTYY